MHGELIHKVLFLTVFILGIFIRSLYAYGARSHIKRRSLRGHLKLLFELRVILELYCYWGRG